jgi:translation initiation factor 2 alpha subunit (eIF-2alpha)
MENKVLTQEEIQSLKSIQTNQSNLVQALGTVEYRIQLLELDKQTLKTQLQKQTEDETKIAEELQEKYGDGNIDLEKGEFIPVS